MTIAENPNGTGPFKSILNITISIVGIGVLSLPKSIDSNGWAVSLLLLVATGLLCHHTVQLLHRCIYRDPLKPYKTYEDVGRAAFGPLGGVLVAGTTYFNLIAVCTSLLLLARTPLSFLFGLESRTCLYIAFGAVAPFVWIRSLSDLSGLSMLGVSAVMVTLVAVVVFSLSKLSDEGQKAGSTPHNPLPDTWLNLGFGFATFMNSFTVAPCTPVILHSMRRPGDFKRISAIAFLLVAFIFACIGFGGYLGCRDVLKSEESLSHAIKSAASKDNTTKNFTLNLIVQIGLIVICFTHLLALFNPVGTATDRLLVFLRNKYFTNEIARKESNNELSANEPNLTTIGDSNIRLHKSEDDKMNFAIAGIARTLVLGISLWLAMIIPNFDFAVRLLGSTLVMLLQLIYPFLLHYVLIGKHSTHKQRHLVMTLASVTLGVVGMVFGTWSTVTS